MQMSAAKCPRMQLVTLYYATQHEMSKMLLGYDRTTNQFHRISQIK